jgi:tetratricopeptide (TPR) repeat protein
MSYIRNILILLSILTVSCTAHTEKKNKQEAIDLNNQAVKIMSENPDSALILLDRAIEIDKNDYLFYSNKANIFLARKDYAKAISSLEKAVDVNPDLAEGSLFLGILYDKTDQTEKAKKLYERAISIFDNRLKKHEKYELSNRMNRAVTLILLGQINQGKKELEKLLTENPENTVLQYLQNFDKEKYFNEILGIQ